MPFFLLQAVQGVFGESTGVSDIFFRANRAIARSRQNIFKGLFLRGSLHNFFLKF